MSLADRLWPKVQVTGCCWLWTGGTTRDGYGLIGLTWKPKQTFGYVHRVAYELLVGPIPAGLELDHLCRVRRCCNPDHLLPKTHRENVLAGYSPSALAARTTFLRA